MKTLIKKAQHKDADAFVELMQDEEDRNEFADT